MKNLLLKIFSIGIFTTCFFGFSSAQQPSMEIIPSSSNTDDAGRIVEDISSGGHVWDIYKEKSQNMDLATQFATGVMTRDTILDYAVYAMKFIMQLALLAAAVMFVIFGYQKATGKGTSKQLVHVIIGILVVIFSYVIIRTIWYAFIS